MYYYGYGVTPDRETGYFWIKRSANQQYEPAVKALRLCRVRSVSVFHAHHHFNVHYTR